MKMHHTTQYYTHDRNVPTLNLRYSRIILGPSPCVVQHQTTRLQAAASPSHIVHICDRSGQYLAITNTETVICILFQRHVISLVHVIHQHIQVIIKHMFGDTDL